METLKNRFFLPSLAILEKVQTRQSVAFLILMGGLANLIAYQIWGVRTVGDSARYIEYADVLIENGWQVDPHNIWYLSYVLFLAVTKSTALGLKGTVIAQGILSIAAGISIYFSTKNLTRQNSIALLAGMFFFGWFKISQWNMYIMCESFYLSLIAFTSWAILRYPKKSSLLLLLLGVLLFAKPTAVAFVLSYLGWVLWRLNASLPIKIGLVAALVFIILFGLNFMLATFTLVETYATGDVVYGCSLLGENCPAIFKLHVPILWMPPEDTAPVMKPLLFIGHNFLFTVKLALAKMLAFWVSVKPYFTFSHNLFLAITLYPLYYFSMQYCRERYTEPIAFFTSGSYILTTLIVMFTIEDWDGRFMLPLLPILIITGWAGIHSKYMQTTR